MPGRILMIEDNADYGEILGLYLRTAGFALDIARDGREGLERVRQAAYDVVITDLMLPSHSGYEICTLLKQDVRYRKIPIVVLTASKLLPKDEALAKSCGADAFFPKSTQPGQLVEQLKRLLAPDDAPSRVP